MSPDIYQEGRFLAASICMGAGIAFVYDCLRIFRRVASHGMFWISMEDFFYWIFVAAAVFGLLYYENNGAFRWFAVLGATVGMAVYRWTLGRIFVAYISRFLLGIKKLCRKIVSWILKPWHRLGGFVQNRAVSGVRRLNRSARHLKKRLTLHNRLIKIELGKRCGNKTGRKIHGQKKDRHQKEKTK